MYGLSSTQREILEALVRLYEEKKRMIKSKEVADLIGKDEGTVRNVIIGLKALGLVASKTGPSGGYTPTLKAYEIVKLPAVHPTPAYMKVYRNGVETGLTVISIEILDPLNPEGGKVVLRVTGNLSGISRGDVISLGPSEHARLFLEGEVLEIDKRLGQISILVRRFASIPRVSVYSIASKNLITLRPEEPLVDAARTLSRHRIRGAPVLGPDNSLDGILTEADITRAVADERILTAKVADYMTRKVVTVREDDDILKAMRLMDRYDVGRLVVVDALGTPKGILTRTDILRLIAGLEKK